MSTEVSRQEDHEREFDQELSSLYHAALLDEDFQKETDRDLLVLPEEAKRWLKQPDQAFLHSNIIPPSMQDNLLATLGIISQPEIQPKKRAWWKIFSNGERWKSSFLLGPGFSLPATLAAGILLGVSLPSMMSLIAPPDFKTRGLDHHPAIEPTPATSASVPDTIPEAVKQDPQQWLDAIAGLLHQGKLMEAREALRQFEETYPNYKPTK